MTTFLVSLVAVFGFAAGIYGTGIVGAAQRAIAQANAGLSAMLDSGLSDDEKEAAVRKAGIALIVGSGAIAWRLVACLAAAALPIYLAEFAGLSPAETVFDLMLRLDYIIGVSVALIVLVWLFKRKDPDKPQTGYGSGDRFLHMLAFSGPGIQKFAIRLEDMFLGRKIKGVADQPPVLVTSLARGGTTAVLNALHDLPGMVTHTYRDMPFATAPLLWSRLSAPLKREVARQKRAHGDGLSIDLDSPEAFDEIFWMLYWPGKYKSDRIPLWTPEDAKAEAAGVFRRMFRKMAVLRGGGRGRYLSKNNANIARLQLLPEMFPDCGIVVLLRNPAAHAASLLRQHENFLTLQAEDDFVRRYMRDIGHLEFGQLHRPIGFDGFDPGAYDPRTPDYWLAYWIAAFVQVQAHIAQCHILAQDDLRQTPDATMQALCKGLGIETGEIDFASYFRDTPDVTDRDVFDPALLAQADQLYATLAQYAVGPQHSDKAS
ncbi:sulfotransferase [uncultured Roseobacter sp.]|uniref:sulfotransferase n=1 Tax=uncultured Roseobacter sp. TaxID=114847 RepID=UPI00260976F4|nr:sulfotransferase [uncultured Roseobacter sp.]